jgi:hypothetical protein
MGLRTALNLQYFMFNVIRKKNVRLALNDVMFYNSEY